MVEDLGIRVPDEYEGVGGYKKITYKSKNDRLDSFKKQFAFVTYDKETCMNKKDTCTVTWHKFFGPVK